MLIAIKLRKLNEHIFFALFLVNYAFNSWLMIIPTSWIINALSWSVTAGSFVYAMIKYPGESARSLYEGYFSKKKRPTAFTKAVLFFAEDKHFWLIFFPMMIGLQVAGHFLPGVFFNTLNIVVNICGLIYFRISYTLAGKTDRSRLAWILWGIVAALVVTLVELLINIFYPEASPVIFQVSFALTAAIICISVIMAVFFAGFLDTGLVVRGTIVYSAIFLFVVFLFSVIENLIEHHLAAMLHIENDMVSAFLAGFLALLINPLHKKLEHVLPKF